MVRLELSTQLSYEIFDAPCNFIFNIEAARTPRQTVLHESLQLPPGVIADRYTDPLTHSRFLRLSADPGCAGAPEAARRIRERFGAKHIVLSLGRMTYYKGFDVLIDAAADLPDGSVIVVGGDGELLERHRETVRRKGLSNKIFFVGHIPHEDLAAYFEAATVFCLASTQRAEAYGVVLLEAMAGAKPVVTTEVPGSAVSWINQPGVTGLSVPVGDAKALAGAVNRIAADAAFADRLGRAARARYEQHLSAETMIQSTLNLYRQLMANTESEAGTVFGNNRY